jgi:hypothetical protein
MSLRVRCSMSYYIPLKNTKISYPIFGFGFSNMLTWNGIMASREIPVVWNRVNSRDLSRTKLSNYKSSNVRIDVTLRRVRLTTVAVEKYYLLQILGVFL